MTFLSGTYLTVDHAFIIKSSFLPRSSAFGPCKQYENANTSKRELLAAFHVGQSEYGGDYVGKWMPKHRTSSTDSVSKILYYLAQPLRRHSRLLAKRTCLALQYSETCRVGGGKGGIRASWVSTRFSKVALYQLLRRVHCPTNYATSLPSHRSRAGNLIRLCPNVVLQFHTAADESDYKQEVLRANLGCAITCKMFLPVEDTSGRKHNKAPVYGQSILCPPGTLASDKSTFNAP